MSGDDRWTDVIDQVLDALDDANVSDSATRDALAEGVKAALESLDTGIGLDVQIIGEGFPKPPSEPPTVEVVTGGRSDDEPPSEGERPALRIANEAPEGPEEGTLSADHSPLFTRVNIIENGRSKQPSALPGLDQSGWIHVNAGGPPEANWQTVYRGQRLRLYRIACSKGTLDVTVDGEPIERLLPGQSIDTEGRAIRVTTTEADGALGGYTPIKTTGNEE
jgi:hypothetical protein